ncbi:formylmethanofuran dehydrogenase subunit C [[Eubacterium] cellulosolvens]
MPKYTLRLKKKIQNPLHLDKISPDEFLDKNISTINDIETWEGNKKIKLKSIFNIKKDLRDKTDEVTIEILGNMANTRRIGYKMTQGKLRIKGAGGMYLGESMTGGEIMVEGDAGSWLGSEMIGGKIEVSGNVGDAVGTASRGSTQGMRGGKIIVNGNSGSDIGAWMQSGTIRICGNSKMFPGLHMKGGTIYIGGNCLGRVGAHMIGGKIIISGNMYAQPLPSFSFDSIRGKTRIEKDSIEGPFYVYTGDNNENGNGRIFINVESNSQLKWYEQFLES